MNQRQSDIRTVKALLIAAEGGNPGEEVALLSERATVALHRLCNEVQEAERRRKALRAPHAVTPEERFLMECEPPQCRVHMGRGCMDEVTQ